MRDVLIGFDSAWADSPKKPGAICACVLDEGRCAAFHPPRCATFDGALDFVNAVSEGADCVLLAIDQPTIVRNHEGSRPVDRVAGSLIGKLGGGAQPARRGGGAAFMFGDGAPIWRFLERLDAGQNPIEARSAEKGRFVMEVFPALALPTIAPQLWRRKKAAKHNPANRNFARDDWTLVALSLSRFAEDLGAGALAQWAEAQALLGKPRKADQDRLDSAICLAIALAWREGPRAETLVIGDAQDGYVATIASSEIRKVLMDAAERLGVAVDRGWEAAAEVVVWGVAGAPV